MIYISLDVFLKPGDDLKSAGFTRFDAFRQESVKVFVQGTVTASTEATRFRPDVKLSLLLRRVLVWKGDIHMDRLTFAQALFLCTLYLSKLITISLTLSKGWTNATRCHKYSRGLIRLLPGVLMLYFQSIVLKIEGFLTLKEGALSLSKKAFQS